MVRASLLAHLAPFVLVGLAACDTGPTSKGMGPEPSSGPAPTAAPAKPRETPNQGPSANAPSEGVLRLGSAIDTKATSIALADVAKAPEGYVGKTFTTTGTVTAVCQHMGCWMEIKDDASAAHIKMAGHAFFVPKTASGRKARVMATLVKADAPQAACEGEGHDGKKGGCRAEAENQLGRPLAKLELVAQGVELL